MVWPSGTTSLRGGWSVEEHGEGTARRRRTRGRSDPVVADSDAGPVAPSPAPDPRAAKRDRDAERGLRGLVGAGPTQVQVGAALRARDASRPTEEDLRRAEQDIVIVRRHYVPPDSLT